MKIEKSKVLLYLKKSGLDKNGKTPLMGRITVNSLLFLPYFGALFFGFPFLINSFFILCAFF